jgi:hypothetical protein
MTIEIATRLGILRGFQSALGFAAPVAISLFCRGSVSGTAFGVLARPA